MRTLVVPSLTILACMLGAAAAAAQQAAEGFTSIFDVAELPDGRVLLTDNRETAIAVVDFARGGAVTPLGRTGGGPLEYRSTSTILRLPGDTLGIYDARQMRLTLVSPDARITGTRAFARPPLPGFAAPRGPDADGAVYFDVRTLRTGTSPGLDRPAVVYRWHAPSERLHAIDTIMNYGPGQARAGIIPMPHGDAWSVLRDGTIVRIAADTRRVEWTAPDGSITRSAPLPEHRVGVDDAERNDWLVATFSQPAGSIEFRGGGAREQVPAERRREFPADVFPSTLPPFERGWVPAAPDGTIWLRRARPAGARSTVFDIVRRDGTSRRHEVAGDIRIVGFGASAIYLVRRDEVGLEWLQRLEAEGAG